MEGGWGIKIANKAEKESKEKYLRRTLKFNNILRSSIRTSRWQDVLIEIVKKGGRPTNLNLLDQAAIDVEADSNGDPTKWKLNEAALGLDSRRGSVTWTPEQVTHIKFKDAIFNLWGESDIQTAYETVKIKDSIRGFILWLFKTNQFRNHFAFANKTNIEQIRLFVSSYRQSSETYDKPVITEGDVEVKALREVTDLNMLIDILNWCDNQLIALFPSTKVNLGLGGEGGRSESDSLGDVNRSYIKEIQGVIYDAINYDLFPKLGFSSNDEFYWEPMDRMTKQKIFESVQIMRNSGFSDKAVIEFMEKEGLSFKSTKIFEPNEELKANKDLMPSRISTKEGEADKNVGTGEDSSTRDEQLVANSEETNKLINDTWTYPFIQEEN